VNSTDILAIQICIKRYIQKNYQDKIYDINRESLEDGTLHLLQYVTEEPSVLMLTKEDLQDYFLKGWERPFQKKLKNVFEDDKQHGNLDLCYT
jgi:hypothetical protein